MSGIDVSNIREITFMMYLATCNCRCGHCKAVGKGQLARLSQPPLTPLRFAQCRDVMERFRKWRNESGHTGIRLNFGDSECSDYPEICDKIRYACDIRRRDYSLVMCNGMRIKPEEEQRTWLRNIYAAGARLIVNTIYGTEQEHDRYAGRAGDFQHIVLLNRLAAETGLKRMHVVFFSKSRAPYLERIVEQFTALPGTVHFQFRPFYGSMQDEFIQSERTTKREFEAMPEYVRRGTQFHLRTRNEWTEYFVDQYSDPLRHDPHMVLDFNIEQKTIDRLAHDDIENLISESAARYMRRWNNTVSLIDLAKAYCPTDKSDDFLYTFRDMESSLINMYAADHPNHGEMHQFGFEAPEFRR